VGAAYRTCSRLANSAIPVALHEAIDPSCIAVAPCLHSRDPLRTAETQVLRKPSTDGQACILVVDDEELYRRALERILVRAGHRILLARDASEALGMVETQSIDLVLCDVQMPGLSGHELVRQIRELHPDLPCIVVTGYSSTESSLEALRAGAFWYLEKPFDQSHLDVVRKLVAQAIEHGRLKSENRRLQSQLRSRYKFDSIVGKSPALQRVLESVEKVAQTDSTVLITGESGTGKELIARAVHYNSTRANRAMVTVNCGAIPEELLESELFGHVKGAFTSAHAAREGRFSLANGGTIFLDEIGDMSPNLQVKLLRALQEKTFEPVGSSQTQQVDVRVIAATNQHLEELIQKKLFREDLYYRLNVLPIEMPPLRERSEDVPLLVHFFLDAASRNESHRIRTISEPAMAHLMEHDWPGNVRELENLVERLVVLTSTDEIGVDDLPEPIRNAQPRSLGPPRVTQEGLSFNDAVDQFESDLILQALEITHWNKNRASQLLRLNRTTLLEKIRKKGLERPTSED